MLIHPWDASDDVGEWQDFVRAQGFGQLIASGRDRDVPIVVPTQFVLGDGIVLAHLARPNPIWHALDENPNAVLSIAGDWAYIPAAWKVLPGEDGSLGVPTTYYGAVQLVGTIEILDDEESKLEILRATLATVEPGSSVADPSAHITLLNGIRGIRLTITDVKAKFKYGGNVSSENRAVVERHLQQRNGPGDAAAIKHLSRRTP